MLVIFINQQPFEVVAETSLRELHTQLNLPQQGCVFSLNGDVIPRSEWEHVGLSAGDQISLFQAIAGG
ncbi:MAG: sulfur carrier protein ThiS [Vibrio sp.]